MKSTPIIRNILTSGLALGAIMTSAVAQELPWQASASINSPAALFGIDGIVSWQNSWWAPANQSPGMFYQVDLRRARTFRAVSMTNSASSASFFARNFNVLVSSNGSEWVTAALNQAGSPTGLTTASFPAVTARYVRVQIASSSPQWWAIGEFGLTAAPLNRAGWSASASNNAPASLFAIDAQNSFTSSWFTGANQAPGMWFQVDTKKATDFNSLELSHVVNVFNQFPAAFDVQKSDDGNEWVTIGSGVGSASGTTKITFPSTQTARYVRVTLTQGASKWWAISDFNLFNL